MELYCFIVDWIWAVFAIASVGCLFPTVIFEMARDRNRSSRYFRYTLYTALVALVFLALAELVRCVV